MGFVKKTDHNWHGALEQWATSLEISNIFHNKVPVEMFGFNG